ncbi:MAG TPA: helix-turn-helix domain-containing protein [archaeon]|nr:helix-turn-helix domain-containing protein [archaeon]
MESKEIAATILLPLIEFEFAFNGAQKPAITQAESNFNQLKVIFGICKTHDWVASQRISKLGNKNEYWFKLSNTGFKEIYSIAGPMADKGKDKWALLLCERAGKTEKSRLIKDDVLRMIKNSEGADIYEICLKTRRLPYTVSRHIKNLEKQGLIKKTFSGWVEKR